MLKVLQAIFSIITIAFAGYGLFTGDFRFQAYMMFFLGLTMLVMGLREYKKGHKGYGLLSIIVFVFILFVSIESLVFR